MPLEGSMICSVLFDQLTVVCEVLAKPSECQGTAPLTLSQI